VWLEHQGNRGARKNLVTAGIFAYFIGVRQSRCVFSRTIYVVCIVIVWLTLGALGLSQDARASPNLLADVNSTVAETNEIAPSHAFWDRTNTLLFIGVGVLRGLDYASTRNMQARGREEILLPDDVVNNSAAFAAVEAAGTAASIGLSYWMHRTRHHKLERWVSIVHISVTGFGVVRNYCLDSKHPPVPTK
jgi:hypothetical protein